MLPLIKVLLTPLLIAGATLASRRWGQAVAGWIVGLPLTSGPVSVFFALEQGRTFAAASAHSTLFGLAGVGLFCVVYARSARHMRWPGATAVTLVLYLAGVSLLSLFSPPLGWSLLVTLLLFKVFLFFIGLPEDREVGMRPPWWDLPLRMAAATALVLVLTAAAAALGPEWSGLLAPFPVFTYVMVVFAHARLGACAVRQLLRGVVIGCYAAAAFFVTVSLTVESLPLPTAYALATGAAVGVNAFTFALLRRIR